MTRPLTPGDNRYKPHFNIYTDRLSLPLRTDGLDGRTDGNVILYRDANLCKDCFVDSRRSVVALH